MMPYDYWQNEVLNRAPNKDDVFVLTDEEREQLKLMRKTKRLPTKMFGRRVVGS